MTTGTGFLTSAVNWARMQNTANVLREYAVNMRVVHSIDSQDTPCAWCGLDHRTVAANVHYTDFQGDDHSEDSCMQCLASLLDTCFDIDPKYTVVVEILAAGSGT